MKVFQIGAAGGVGRRLTQLLTADGDSVTGMHRGPAQGDTVREAGGTPVIGDLIADTVDELDRKMRGHDAVVFSAGAHGTGMDKTTLIDGKGLQKAAIVRPGTLLDTPAAGCVTAGRPSSTAMCPATTSPHSSAPPSASRA